MTFKEILSRLTGISTPVFGVSWNPSQAECTVAKRVIAFLEDRRVLFVPSEMETPHHCVESVLQIRQFLTSEIGALDNTSQLSQNLRAMRSACRKFLEATSDKDGCVIRFGNSYGHWASWVFNGALGEMRGVFGVHLASLSAKYGLDVEEGLSAIIPAEDETSSKLVHRLIRKVQAGG
jgi:hypothetical protein